MTLTAIAALLGIFAVMNPGEDSEVRSHTVLVDCKMEVYEGRSLNQIACDG